MRFSLWLVLLTFPAPITSIGGDRNPDGSIVVFWTLPLDPSVVGITIERERLDEFDDLIIFELTGTPTSFTDFSASGSGSYRYWVFTRNASGQLSTGVFLEVISPSDLDDDHVDWVCFVGASGGSPPWALGLAALVIGATLAARRLKFRG